MKSPCLTLPRRFLAAARAIALFLAAVVVHSICAAAPVRTTALSTAPSYHYWTSFLQSLPQARVNGQFNSARLTQLLSAVPQNPRTKTAWPALRQRLLQTPGLWSHAHTRAPSAQRAVRSSSLLARTATTPTNPYGTFYRTLLSRLYAGGTTAADWHPYTAADELTPNFQPDMGDGESFHVSAFGRAARTSDSTTAANYREVCRQLEEREVALLDSLLMTSAQSVWAVLANASSYPDAEALFDAVADALVVALQQVDQATYLEILTNAPMLADAAVSYSGSEPGLRARAQVYYAALTAIAGSVYLAIDPASVSQDGQNEFAELGPIVAKEVFKCAKLSATLRPLYRDLGIAMLEKHSAYYYFAANGYYSVTSSSRPDIRLNALTLIALAQGYPVTQLASYKERALSVISVIRFGTSGSCHWVEYPATATFPACGAHYVHTAGNTTYTVTYSAANLAADALMSWAAFSSENRSSYLDQAGKIITYTTCYLYDASKERIMHDSTHNTATNELLSLASQYCSGCNAYGALLMQGYATGASPNP